MILLDTHVWVWWVHDDLALPAEARFILEARSSEGLAVSAISCWEVAKLVERGRLDLSMPLSNWMDLALGASGIILLPLLPEIAVESVTLPGDFHRDPADQLIVATARKLNLPLLTFDQRIRSYPHVDFVEDLMVHDR